MRFSRQICVLKDRNSRERIVGMSVVIEPAVRIVVELFNISEIQDRVLSKVEQVRQ